MAEKNEYQIIRVIDSHTGFGLRPNTELAQLLGCLLDELGNIQTDSWQH
ncbi:hypothetical protein ACSLVK_21935 [Photorhabdus tasmaniensis]